MLAFFKSIHLRKIYIAIGAMLLGIVFVDLYGVIIKTLGNIYSTTQLTVFRNAFAVIPLLILFFFSQGYVDIFKNITRRFIFLCFLRGASFLFMNITYFIAIINMNFATASTLTFSSPFFIIILSIFFLQHKIGIYKWSAVIIGFVGVILIMKPTNDVFSLYSIFPILTALAWAFYMIILKFIPANYSSAKIEFYTLIFSFLGSILLLPLTSGYTEVESTNHWILMVLIGISGGTATVLFIYAYRLVAPSSLAPFEYLGIPSSFILGWIFFNEAPLNQLFPGVIGIIAAGMIVIWHDRKLSEFPEKTKKIY